MVTPLSNTVSHVLRCRYEAEIDSIVERILFCDRQTIAALQKRWRAADQSFCRRLHDAIPQSETPKGAA